VIRGSCLCGDVAWQVDGPVELMSHCHCSRCRKAHGTAFATYLRADAGDFELRGRDRIHGFESQPGFMRPSCRRCGSVVPDGVPFEAKVSFPAGPLDDDPGVRPLAHIFVASKAPWYEITDALPRFDAYPPGFDFAVLPDRPRPPARPGVVRGSCLCGGVGFVVEGPATTARYCHCLRCRKARAAAHATNLVAPIASVRFERGADRVRTFELPEARFFSQSFCADCGGKLPRLDPGRAIAIVPMGALDDDPAIAIHEQIWVGSKAPWYDITDAIPQRPEGPLPS
jgi:hypothetical protein